MTDFNENMTHQEKYNLCCSIIKQSNDQFDILQAFKEAPDDTKLIILKIISVKEKMIHQNIIDQFNVDQVLECFPLEQRLDVITNILFKDFQENYESPNLIYEQNYRFTDEAISHFLKAFKDEPTVELQDSNIYKTLVFLINEYKKLTDKQTQTHGTLLDPGRIISIFYKKGYDINIIAEYLITEKVITRNIGYRDILEGIPKSERNKTIDFLLNHTDISKTITEKEFFNMLDTLNIKDVVDYYTKYCLIDKRFNWLEPLKRRAIPEHFNSLDYMKILIECLTPEEFNKSFNDIKNAFTETEKYPTYSDKYDLVITTFAELNELDADKVKVFVRKFGYGILNYLEDITIKKYMNTDSDKLDKLFELVSNKTITFNKSVLYDILNSLLQREFMLEERNTYLIFSVFEELLQNNKYEEIRALLDKISNEFDFSSLLEKNNSSMEDLYNRISNHDLDLLHKITNAYISYKREQYVKNKLTNLEELVDMDKIVTREHYKKDMMDFPLIIPYHCRDLIDVHFTKEQQEVINNQDLLLELVAFKSDPKNVTLSNEKKAYLKPLNEVLDILYDNKVNFYEYNEYSPFKKDFPYELGQRDITNEYLIGILLESNYDKLLAILNDESKYNELKEFLEKYKVIGWQNSFYKIMDKCDIAFSEGTIASLISNFDIIKERLDKTNNKSLTSIIDYANSYSKGHGLYKTLFGTEDFRLLDNNPGPNKASMSRRDRLSKCGDLIPKMYAKNTFTVPTVDEIITLDNGKQIRIIIGNSTNMMNLTYGERTGACMRKGGAYNDLFDFCLQDKNGFHVRFVNPESDNFVSRVSGMRNGNTLFLNELRNSVDPEYTDDDLYEASKKISKYLINISKTSSCPLDNVLVSVEYALKDHLADAQNIKLNLETRADALRHKPFDLGVAGILLANSTDDKTVLPYNFTDDVPEYESIRDEVRVYRDHDAVNRIKQIRIINDLINGVPQDKIKLSYGDEIPDYVISGEDFYISYINDIPEVFILDSRKNNPRTIEEVKGIINSNSNEIKPNNRTQ